MLGGAGHHPWHAIPFDSPTRTATSAFFKVSGIPSLIVFAPNGKIVCQNAVGTNLNQATLDSWNKLALTA